MLKGGDITIVKLRVNVFPFFILKNYLKYGDILQAHGEKHQKIIRINISIRIVSACVQRLALL